MRRIWIMAAAAMSVCGAATAWAQPAPSLETLMREWEALPEDPNMREACSNQLRYSTKIAALKSGGATLATIMRWAEQESERSGAALPSEPLLPIGTQMILIKLIREAYIDAPVYEKVAGGFPQWVYRSCLKGRPID
jgi:hypothetical protein